MVILAVDNKRLRLSKLKRCLWDAFPKDTIMGFTSLELAVNFGSINDVDYVFADIGAHSMDDFNLALKVHRNNENAKIYYIADEAEITDGIDDSFISGCLIRPITEEAIRSLHSMATRLIYPATEKTVKNPITLGGKNKC